MIIDELYKNQDLGYREFQANLTPTLTIEDFIGVRTPALRTIAKDLVKSKDEAVIAEREEFLASLPHKFFDENQVHSFIICLEKDFGTCIEKVEAFLPYVDNWATCDQLSPKVFKKHRNELRPYVEKWIDSDKTYTKRFGIGMVMEHFLDEDFDAELMEKVSKVRSEEYYINMMTAWYFATALAKQWDVAVKYIENKALDTWTHNKAIQKSIESYRVSDEHKAYLRSLKIKK